MVPIYSVCTLLAAPMLGTDPLKQLTALAVLTDILWSALSTTASNKDGKKRILSSLPTLPLLFCLWEGGLYFMITTYLIKIGYGGWPYMLQ